MVGNPLHFGAAGDWPAPGKASAPRRNTRTSCAGFSDDSVCAALVRALFELQPSQGQVSKVSGIGCSSKTPACFLLGSHGINSVHGRIPAVAAGASGANQRLYNVGVSGDGDSLPIGLGQFTHAIRCNLYVLYVIKNKGVYGLHHGPVLGIRGQRQRAEEGRSQRAIAQCSVTHGLDTGGDLRCSWVLR